MIKKMKKSYIESDPVVDMERPLMFSVVTVTRNNLDGLKRTHKSLGAQTFRDFEWVVVDGGSTDETVAYLTPTKAIWCSEPDQGIYDAMNKALAECKGEYILFLNAGDILASPNVFSRLAQSVHEHKFKPDFIYGDSLETRGAGKQPALKMARDHRKLRRGMFTHHQAMLYRRTATGKLRYDTRYKIAADYDFTCRFLKRKKICAMYVELPICVFESGGLSQKYAEAGRHEQAMIRKNLRLCDPLSNALIRARQALAWGLRQRYPGLYHAAKSSKASFF